MWRSKKEKGCVKCRFAQQVLSTRTYLTNHLPIYSAQERKKVTSEEIPQQDRILCRLLEEEQILRHLQGPCCFVSTVHEKIPTLLRVAAPETKVEINRNDNNNKNQTNTSRFVVLLQGVNGFADLAEDLLHRQLGVHLQDSNRKHTHPCVHACQSWRE